jgi:hypothetical protein
VPLGRGTLKCDGEISPDGRVMGQLSLGGLLQSSILPACDGTSMKGSRRSIFSGFLQHLLQLQALLKHKSRSERQQLVQPVYNKAYLTNGPGWYCPRTSLPQGSGGVCNN